MSTINLVTISPGATWASGRLVDENNMTDQQILPWMGSDHDNRGFVRLDNIKLEDGRTADALRTHPKWVGRGTIKGWHPWVKLPENAVFEAEVGFVAGAKFTDGVTFMVWEHHLENNQKVWTRIARLHKGYTGKLATIRADLTHLAGKEVGIELRADAGVSSGQDWAAWVNPRIVSSTTPAEMPVTLQLKKFTCLNADEDSWFSNGDEPYLFVLAIFADGMTINASDLSSATVRIYSPTKTHGNLAHTHVDKGDSFFIPQTTGLFRTHMKPVIGLPLVLGKKMATAGIAVIAMEEDSTPTSAVNKARKVLIEETEKELNKLIRSSKPVNDAAIKQIMESIKEKVINTIKKESLSNISGIFSVIDPDDYINAGFKYWSYKEIQDAGAKGLLFKMDFQKSGVHYSIDVIIQNY